MFSRSSSLLFFVAITVAITALVAIAYLATRPTCAAAECACASCLITTARELRSMWYMGPEAAQMHGSWALAQRLAGGPSTLVIATAPATLVPDGRFSRQKSHPSRSLLLSDDLLIVLCAIALAAEPAHADTECAVLLVPTELVTACDLAELPAWCELVTVEQPSSLLVETCKALQDSGLSASALYATAEATLR